MDIIKDIDKAEELIFKWQNILNLKDWDIRLKKVEKEWRKTGDIKIDSTDKRAILMLNTCNPKDRYLEPIIVHELLHLKLWGMDQMIDYLIQLLFGNDESDPKYQFAFGQFMEILETTVEDLSKSFIKLSGETKEVSFGRVEKQVEQELK